MTKEQQRIFDMAEGIAIRCFPSLFRLDRGEYLTDCIEMYCAKKMYLKGYMAGKKAAKSKK